MSVLLPWFTVTLLILAGLPWSFWLLARHERHPDWALSLALAIGVSTGTLTLAMFWWSVFGLLFTAIPMTLVTLAILLSGAVVWQRGGRPLPQSPQFGVWASLALVLLALVTASILFNAAYWPFSRDDALGIYHAQAQAMTASRALLPLTGADSLYLTYPPLMPLAYTYVYLLAGWEHEYLARVISALLALGSLPAAYALGREAGGRLTGALAALVLALAPTFGRWAAAGYVDLPAAFFITLSAVFALRLWRSGRTTDALLSGVTMGLAAWTKNAALIEVAVLTAWLLAGIGFRRFGMSAAAVGLLAGAAVAMPWYLRNWFGAGFLVPATAWTDDARPSLETLLLFITHPQIYGVSGWFMLGGVAFSVVQMLRRDKAALLLLAWTVPFFGAWWLLTSYDPRLLLPVAPVFAVMAGWLLATGWRVMPRRHRQGTRIAGAVLGVALTASAVWNSVEFKSEILRDPFMTDAAKREIVLPARQFAPGEP